MGKIRVSTLGSEEEKELREKRKVKRDEKKMREDAKGEKTHPKNLKGGQKIKSVGAESEADIDKMVALAREVEEVEAGGIKTEKTKDKKPGKARIRGKNYKAAVMKLDPRKSYAIDEAVNLLRVVSYSKFDPSVELHINTVEKGLRGAVSLPHGTGKKIRIEIVTEDNVDKLVEAISQGKFNFDALIAHPKAMGKLARVAKFLGPKGLMPNPKNGTISQEPEKVAKKLEGGEINWKTEAEFPIIHALIGKLSFKDKQLVDNFNALVKSISTDKIQKVVLKSTMSPGIKVSFA